MTNLTAPETQRQRPWLPGALIVAVVAAVVAFSTLGLPGLGSDSAKVLTTKGLTKLVADIKDEFGTTQVVELNLFEDYAIVEVPVSGGAGRRTQSYRYDGGFEKFGAGSSRTDESSLLIDLSQLDVPATLALLKTAPKTVGLPDETVSNVTLQIANGPGAGDGEIVSTYVMVDSDYDESGFVRADLSGQVIDVDKVTD